LTEPDQIAVSEAGLRWAEGEDLGDVREDVEMNSIEGADGLRKKDLWRLKLRHGSLQVGGWGGRKLLDEIILMQCAGRRLGRKKITYSMRLIYKCNVNNNHNGPGSV
jgi:hypothetical protein